MQHTWLSAHLFYAGTPSVLLNNLVTPLLQSTGWKAFFVRYWEGGPHIRLRISVKEQGLQDAKALLALYSSHFFEQHPSCRDDAGYKQVKLFPNDTLQYIPYEPEIDRYGNAGSISWAERQFAASSAYVLAHIHDTSSWDDSVALLHAIRMNMALLFALGEGEELTLYICRRFVQAWLPRLYDPAADPVSQQQCYTRSLQSRFDAYAGSLTSATAWLWENMGMGTAEDRLEAFITANRKIFSQYRRLNFDQNKYADIIGSFIHMGHNRLGISNFDEAYIMFLTLKCMEHIYANLGA